jgi:hypothetical protein
MKKMGSEGDVIIIRRSIIYLKVPTSPQERLSTLAVTH